MNSLLPFQKLPRALRRHKLLRLFSCCNGGGPVQRVRVNNRFEAFIDVRDGFARLIAIEDEFEADFFRLAASLLPKENPVFVDVGANFGLMSLGLWHQCGGKIRARLYEPNPHLCGIIRRSIAWNRGDGLELVNAALMDASGEVYLTFDLSHTGAGHVGPSGGGIPVRALVLDDDLKEAAITRVDLLKIDVEGNEGAVLAGLRRSLEAKRIGAVYFEYCQAHMTRSGSAHDPLLILREHGYEIFLRDPFAVRGAGGQTHRLPPKTAGAAPLELALLANAPQTQITDLLALPAGRAEQLAALPRLRTKE